MHGKRAGREHGSPDCHWRWRCACGVGAVVVVVVPRWQGSCCGWGCCCWCFWGALRGRGLPRRSGYPLRVPTPSGSCLWCRMQDGMFESRSKWGDGLPIFCGQAVHGDRRSRAWCPKKAVRTRDPRAFRGRCPIAVECTENHTLRSSWFSTVLC